MNTITNGFLVSFKKRHLPDLTKREVCGNQLKKCFYAIF